MKKPDPYDQYAKAKAAIGNEVHRQIAEKVTEQPWPKRGWVCAGCGGTHANHDDAARCQSDR